MFEGIFFFILIYFTHDISGVLTEKNKLLLDYVSQNNTIRLNEYIYLVIKVSNVVRVSK
jgi:hypothetical protein